MDDQQISFLSMLGSWFSGLATFGAVSYALYLQRKYESKNQPTMTAIYSDNDKYNNTYVPPEHINSSNSIEELWVRICLNNESRITAKDVELRFISVQREKVNYPEHKPKWWFKASNLNAISVNIPRKLEQHFDIFYIKNDTKTDDDISFFLATVPPDFKPWAEEKKRIEEDVDNQLEIGWEYTLQFALVCSNADPKYYQMVVKIDSRTKQDPEKKSLIGEDGLKKRINIVSFSEINKN